eukprot:TRINITY_DN10170_c0_g1_i1.p1 TRINITY_DN10170_c0_g1~~TRINITY_DN10170_c0_g1_i1.p1  ORF type:complete len:622 (+),score=42.90 TRINITY_DN10170_c0_g1_i1:40-1905(+)
MGRTSAVAARARKLLVGFDRCGVVSPYGNPVVNLLNVEWSGLLARQVLTRSPRARPELQGMFGCTTVSAAALVRAYEPALLETVQTLLREGYDVSVPSTSSSHDPISCAAMFGWRQQTFNASVRFPVTMNVSSAVVLALFFPVLIALSADIQYESLLGSALQSDPRVMIEGWNMCNRCGRHCSVHPRWADCVLDGTQRVTEAANDAGLPLSQQSQSTCDAGAAQKERSLGDLCKMPAPPVNSGDDQVSRYSYFWSAMLKSGNFIDAEEGRLCGLWCWPNCSRQRRNNATLKFNNKAMNQPSVKHVWSRKNDAGNWYGAFYGTWDLETKPPAPGEATPLSWNQSYFALEWFDRNGTGRILRNWLQTSSNYPWLMLYTGVDAAEGLKGGYPWNGRGMMIKQPRSSPRWLAQDNTFYVRFWLNISAMQTRSSFYLLNMAACWKLNGHQCDGNTSSDVTRYILMDISDVDERDSCNPTTLDRCPEWHATRDGRWLHRNDSAFPHDAYSLVGWRSSGGQHGGRCGGFDCFSNPQQQDFIKLRPSAEWAQYGFPKTLEEARKPGSWDLNAGELTATISMQGTEPEFRQWHTFNIGPEMGLSGAKPTIALWEISDFDVFAPVGPVVVV